MTLYVIMFHLLSNNVGDNDKFTVSLFYCCLLKRLLFHLLLDTGNREMHDFCAVTFTVGLYR